MKTTYFKSNSFMLKAIIIAVLVLLMLIPVSMVKSLITERLGNMIEVKDDISSKWGGKQLVSGPVLVLPYDKKDKNGEVVSIENAYFLPDKFNVDGVILPEERSRGIYTILCYKSELSLSGQFRFPDYDKLGLKSELIHWDKAYLLVGISYMQGIKNKIDFKLNGTSYEITSYMPEKTTESPGFMVKIPLDENNKKNSYDFDFDLSLNGTDGISFQPVGRQTNVHVTSEWESASFTGNFLPTIRKVNEDNTGFDAQWDIHDYNRNYPPYWTGANIGIYSPALGVDLLQPVEQYQMSMRSAKYAILFISLTFVVFFLIEIISRKPIHPMQYLLVSFALLLFYCLLLALSEQIGFGLSYLVSSAATIILITVYSLSVFKHTKQTVLLGIFLTILYIFLYVLLQLSEMSLLFGSIGLFITLAVIMYVSRKINWYKNEDETDAIPSEEAGKK